MHLLSSRCEGLLNKIICHLGFACISVDLLPIQLQSHEENRLVLQDFVIKGVVMYSGKLEINGSPRISCIVNLNKML